MTTSQVEPAVGRILTWAGLAGPVIFVADWAVLGALREGYSPTGDAISRLAELGTWTRPEMTVGFVVYGAGLISFGAALRRAVPGPSWLWAAGTGVSTLGVAAFPLGSPASGDIHAVFAVLGYAGLTGLQVAGARVLLSLGHRRAARLSLTSGALTGVCLLTSITVGSAHGLTQRIGLTTGDAWIVVAALALLRLSLP